MNQGIRKTVIWKGLLVCIVISILTVICARAVTGNVKESMTKEQYEVLEQESIREIRKIMSQYYLSNSGVMLTKTEEQGKACVYEVLIHHKGLERLEDLQSAELQTAVMTGIIKIWNADNRNTVKNQFMSFTDDGNISIIYEAVCK